MNKITATILTASILLIAARAQALVIHEGAGMTLGNNDAEIASMVGSVGGGSGIYLGDGFVLTAAHVGAGDLLLDGVNLPMIAGTSQQLTSVDGGLVDLVLFQVNAAAAPDLSLALKADPIAEGQDVLLVGFGVGQTSEPLVGFDGSTFGYLWNDEKAHRSGVTTVSRSVGDVISLGATATPVFTTKFEGTGPSAQGTRGDSGGAAFVLNAAGEYELAGVMVGVTGTDGVSRYNSATYIAEVSRVSQLQTSGSTLPTTGAVPEPSTVLYVAIAFGLGFLRRRR